MCINFRDLNKACPKNFYPLARIGQLVDSTPGCGLLSMTDVPKGYHQILQKMAKELVSSHLLEHRLRGHAIFPKNIGATYHCL
ncbi:UNVERIFIED_CONTAM: hypothetical protein Sindi_0101500, partial [Sesamum indicum]